MSVFGGDSWAREAQCRKRRVDDLLIEGLDASAYKKLPNGKFACLVCPHNPILDTPLSLSMHGEGSRHRAAESRQKERELWRQEEISKRLGLSNCVTSTSSSDVSYQQRKKGGKPLIERTRKAASEIFSYEIIEQRNKCRKPDAESVISSCLYGQSIERKEGPIEMEVARKEVVVEQMQQLDYRERRERELQFTAAGWKRDCHGRWFKDENVEFDSDEEDPNVVLNDK
ncbi:Sodium channel modifier 1 [Forsythia ovata]|uniref:Sodium channel modifier 1 n=1 Tax=Forsythia ovata TaxID=205694 RepID=A0ABD1VJH7_9LAMI